MSRLKEDSKFRAFLASIIICTEQGYKNDELKKLAKTKISTETPYIDVLQGTIVDLLKEGKTNKLQTFGYSLVQENETMQLRENGQAPTDSLNCTFINLNK
jgi:hypothetical protein